MIYVTEDEKDYEIGAGELFFLKKGIRHYGKREIPRGTKWYYVHFFLDDPVIGCTPLHADSTPIETNEPITYMAFMPKKLTGLKNSSLEKQLFELIEFTHSENSYKRIKFDSLFKLLLTDILLFGLAEKKNETLSERICTLLNDNCDKPFSDTFDIPSVSYILPSTDDSQLVYVIDTNRVANSTRDGDMLQICYKTEEIFDLPILTKTWEEGEQQNDVDLTKNDGVRSYSYYMPVKVGGKVIGLVCVLHRSLKILFIVSLTQRV